MFYIKKMVYINGRMLHCVRYGGTFSSLDTARKALAKLGKFPAYIVDDRTSKIVEYSQAGPAACLAIYSRGSL